MTKAQDERQHKQGRIQKRSTKASHKTGNRRICQLLKPDFIQIDCKGHPGWASYPTKIGNAMPEFEKDTLLTDALGDHIVGQYIAGKEKEWESYITCVSSWEVERYIVQF